VYNSMVIHAELHRQSLLQEAEHFRQMRQLENRQRMRLHLPTLFKRQNAAVTPMKTAAPINQARCAEA
jgi:hypothetical protein